ncbi:MAG TPA: phosphatase domain-containing protein, partial [Actinomycetales bacterium]|nr:phosphatase domain-containing protein [Actinomycetales bacterium]
PPGEPGPLLPADGGPPSPPARRVSEVTSAADDEASPPTSAFDSRSTPPPPLHRAARVEDALNRTAARLLRRRGWRPRVLPYTGYGRAPAAGRGRPVDGDDHAAAVTTDGWVRVLGRVLLSPPGVGRSGERSVRGWRHFVSAKLAGVPVTIEVGGVRHVVESSRGGYIDTVVPVPLPPGWSSAVLRVPDSPDVVAALRVVGPRERLGIITDVDDTVLVTALPRPFLAFWNTFVRHEESRRPVPGTVDLFRALTRQAPDAFVVYVSTGAWNVAPALQRFLRRLRLPAGPTLLTDWGPTPDGWFRSGQDHKRATFRRLLDELPQLRWVLVGDDGQHDPQLYDELVWARPDAVRAVVIRQLGATEQLLTHGLPMPLSTTRDAETRGASTTPVPWVLGPNGHALVAELRRLGLLDDGTLAP